MPSITINRAECTSCSTCWSTCPDVFEEDPYDKLSRILEKYRVGGGPSTGESPAEYETRAEDAADICPVSIITVTG
jgi:ferredoxin